MAEKRFENEIKTKNKKKKLWNHSTKTAYEIHHKYFMGIFIYNFFYGDLTASKNGTKRIMQSINIQFSPIDLPKNEKKNDNQ